MLDIRLLGPPEALIDGEAVEVDTRKAIALMAYLAVEGAASRDTLANLFWAESPPDRARATLRRTLSSLRGGIGEEALVADRNRVSLAAELRSDLDDMNAEIDATRTHGHDASTVCPQCIPNLTRATRLYRGDFMAGFSVRDAPEFEDWVRTTAESLRLRAGEAYSRLGMARASVGDYPGAIAAVTEWIDLDQLHEPAHRMLMLLNAWAGDRPGAIDAYRSFVAILDRELRVAPLEETTELYEAILDDDLPPPPSGRHRIKTQTSIKSEHRMELIDREAELDAIRIAFSNSTESGRVVTLIGDSWMGKTRLMEEFLETVDAQVCVGRAFRMEQALPYSVATQILGHLLARIDTTDPRISEWVLDEVARLDPRLAPGRVPAEGERFGELRLFEAFQALVALASADKPLVIAVDDAQWLDSASLQLISYLARRIADTPTLMLIAARRIEVTETGIADLLSESDETLTLHPLTPNELTVLVDEQRAGAILQNTGGVPLLVSEALTNGSDSAAESGVVRYMEAKQRSVTNLGRQVLAAAAVLNGICDASLLRESSGRSEEEIVEAVEELIGAGLLREIPGSEGLGFTLDALESIVYESTSLIRRRLLHKRAAQALEARPRSRTDARIAAAIATHHQNAGSSDAAEWFRLAGDLSRQIYANSEAQSFYERALALGDGDVASLRLALGELAIARGDYSTAIQQLRSAAAQATDETLGVVEHRLGEVQRALGKFSLAEDHFRRAEETHPRPTELYSDWALLLHRLGNEKQARARADRALELASSEGDDEKVARALNIIGVVSVDPAESMDYIERALETSGDNPVLRMAALNNRAHLLGQIGNHDAAIRHVQEAIELAVQTGHRHREAALRSHLADLHHRAGRPAEAADSLTEAVALFSDIDAGAWEPEVWLLTEW